MVIPPTLPQSENNVLQKMFSEDASIARLTILSHAMPPIARYPSKASFSCDTLPLLGLTLDCDRPFYGKK